MGHERLWEGVGDAFEQELDKVFSWGMSDTGKAAWRQLLPLASPYKEDNDTNEGVEARKMEPAIRQKHEKEPVHSLLLRDGEVLEGLDQKVLWPHGCKSEGDGGRASIAELKGEERGTLDTDGKQRTDLGGQIRKGQRGGEKGKDCTKRRNRMCFTMLLKKRCPKGESCQFTHPARQPEEAATTLCLPFLFGQCKGKRGNCSGYHWTKAEKEAYVTIGVLPEEATQPSAKPLGARRNASEEAAAAKAFTVHARRPEPCTARQRNNVRKKERKRALLRAPEQPAGTSHPTEVTRDETLTSDSTCALKMVASNAPKPRQSLPPLGEQAAFGSRAVIAESKASLSLFSKEAAYGSVDAGLGSSLIVSDEPALGNEHPSLEPGVESAESGPLSLGAKDATVSNRPTPNPYFPIAVPEGAVSGPPSAVDAVQSDGGSASAVGMEGDLPGQLREDAPGTWGAGKCQSQNGLENLTGRKRGALVPGQDPFANHKKRRTGAERECLRGASFQQPASTEVERKNESTNISLDALSMFQELQTLREENRRYREINNLVLDAKMRKIEERCSRALQESRSAAEDKMRELQGQFGRAFFDSLSNFDKRKSELEEQYARPVTNSPRAEKRELEERVSRAIEDSLRVFEDRKRELDERFARHIADSQRDVDARDCAREERCNRAIEESRCAIEENRRVFDDSRRELEERSARALKTSQRAFEDSKRELEERSASALRISQRAFEDQKCELEERFSFALRDSQRVFDKKFRKLEDLSARVVEDKAAIERDRERLQEERKELASMKRKSDGIGECIVCMEDWSEDVLRHQFQCGHAVACKQCCQVYIAGQSKPPYQCPLGCNLKKNKSFKPVFLG